MMEAREITGAQVSGEITNNGEIYHFTLYDDGLATHDWISMTLIICNARYLDERECGGLPFSPLKFSSCRSLIMDGMGAYLANNMATIAREEYLQYFKRAV